MEKDSGGGEKNREKGERNACRLGCCSPVEVRGLREEKTHGGEEAVDKGEEKKGSGKKKTR